MKVPHLIALLIGFVWLVTGGCGGFTQPQPQGRIIHSPLATAEYGTTKTTIPSATPTLNQPLVTTTSTTPFQITLDQTALTPPVTAVVYLTIDLLNGNHSESISTIWQAPLTDISQATPIISFTHRQEAFPFDVTLSPDNQSLIYG